MALIRVNKGASAYKTCSIVNPVAGNENLVVVTYSNDGTLAGGVVTTSESNDSDLLQLTYSSGDFTITVKATCHLKMTGIVSIDEVKQAGFTQSWSRQNVCTVLAYSV